MLKVHVSQLSTCCYKPHHNTICLMFRPQERVANSRVPVPFIAVWLNVPQHINKSDFLPTHQTQTQDHVVHDGRRFTISLLVSSDGVCMKCLLEEDSNCDQSMSQKRVSAASHQQAGSTSKLGCWSSAQSAMILGEKPLILFDVSTAENLSTKSLVDQYSSGIRAGGEGQIADVISWVSISLSEIDQQTTSSWSRCSYVLRWFNWIFIHVLQAGVFQF